MSGDLGGEFRKAASRGILALLTLSAIPAVAQNSPGAASVRSPRRVLVSIAHRKLAVTESGNIIAKFDVAVGAAISPSPAGEFTIVSRVANPTYYHTGQVIPSGKDNPVGTRWLGLSKKGYGIHGTNAPRSIGHAASHGCIRLRNRDMERLFTMLRVGDVVQIHGERDEQVAPIFETSVDNTMVAEAQSEPQPAAQEAMASDKGLGN